ncbi:MAG: hypothetical protein JNM24_07500 [Bdellovibrionaceae bacterium]|nr:hypothetical protein [Pseudobdellovibrionaceae bacterium]
MKLNKLFLGFLVVTASVIAQAGELEQIGIIELSTMRDNCNLIRSKMVAAGLRDNAEVVKNSSFAAGLSKDAAARMINAAANGQDILSTELAGKSLSICVFVDREYIRRLENY